MTEPDKNLPSLEALQRKIDEAQALNGTKPEGDTEDNSGHGMGAALQVGIELVAGVAVGSFIGYFLDRWLGTMPWFFIVCFFLGAGAGFRNLIRQAQAGMDTES
ncbi:MAG: AtpZ/AtpI family protein [Rickettsiales bacterium]|nr:AtpZ/AtpI family protein [Rickettsiales bacterium]